MRLRAGRWASLNLCDYLRKSEMDAVNCGAKAAAPL